MRGKKGKKLQMSENERTTKNGHCPVVSDIYRK